MQKHYLILVSCAFLFVLLCIVINKTDYKYLHSNYTLDQIPNLRYMRVSSFKYLPQGECDSLIIFISVFSFNMTMMLYDETKSNLAGGSSIVSGGIKNLSRSLEVKCQCLHDNTAMIKKW